jgi:hypothetical protein
MKNKVIYIILLLSLLYIPTGCEDMSVLENIQSRLMQLRL